MAVAINGPGFKGLAGKGSWGGFNPGGRVGSSEGDGFRGLHHKDFGIGGGAHHAFQTRKDLLGEERRAAPDQIPEGASMETRCFRVVLVFICFFIVLAMPEGGHSEPAGMFRSGQGDIEEAKRFLEPFLIAALNGRIRVGEIPGIQAQVQCKMFIMVSIEGRKTRGY